MPQAKPCPWWVGYFLANPLRKFWQNPARILTPFVRTGMSVLEPGPGMGFFTLEIARLVGPSGRVVAVDLQLRMIEGLQRRARRAGLLDRIDTRIATPYSMPLTGLDTAIDFVFAFAAVHEFPSAGGFFAGASQAMKPGANLLLAEPAGHVGEAEFAAELNDATASGLKIIGHPPISHCLTALLQKP